MLKKFLSDILNNPLFLLSLCAFMLLPNVSYGGFWEVSAGLNYNRSTYSGGSYAWTRRLGGSIGYNFSDSSTVELSYQKSRDRNHYESFEDSTYDDQVKSVNMVWNLLGKQEMFQPYLKVGVGQLNRRASILNAAGQARIDSIDQLTGVIGGGMRIFLTKQFAIRFEATSYLSGAKLKSWKDNFGSTLGGSLYF
ncbi:MAG: porin family protein [Cryobacterium sp.]|nr:porin family protein [Oligoflexia bacterium]